VVCGDRHKHSVLFVGEFGDDPGYHVKSQLRLVSEERRRGGILGYRGSKGAKTMNTRTSLKSLYLARRIRAAGRQIYIQEDDCESTDVPSDGLLIYLFGEVNDSFATNFLGGTAFIIQVNITINLPRFAIGGFGLELEWECAVDWLEDPNEGERPDIYRFGGRELPEFKRGQVLNHRADVCQIHPRGSSLRGYLLGVGDNPIPDRIQHGMMIPGFLSVFDQFSRPFRSPISLWANRSKKLLSSTRSKTSRKRIFDISDPEYGHSLLENDVIEEKELVRAHR
jgi:hypothetical protein